MLSFQTNGSMERLSIVTVVFLREFLPIGSRALILMYIALTFIVSPILTQHTTADLRFLSFRHPTLAW